MDLLVENTFLKLLLSSLVLQEIMEGSPSSSIVVTTGSSADRAVVLFFFTRNLTVLGKHGTLYSYYFYKSGSI